MDGEIIWTCSRFDELDTADLYAILQLRAEVFVLEQDCVYQDMDDIDAEALHVMGHIRDKTEKLILLCYARLMAAGIKYDGASIGRVVTRKSARGDGNGKALMTNAITFCQQHWPGQSITISAQQYLQKFYSELGFKTESAPYSEDGIPHIRMTLTI